MKAFVLPGIFLLIIAICFSCYVENPAETIYHDNSSNKIRSKPTPPPTVCYNKPITIRARKGGGTGKIYYNCSDINDKYNKLIDVLKLLARQEDKVTINTFANCIGTCSGNECCSSRKVECDAFQDPVNNYIKDVQLPDSMNPNVCYWDYNVLFDTKIIFTVTCYCMEPTPTPTQKPAVTAVITPVLSPSKDCDVHTFHIDGHMSADGLKIKYDCSDNNDKIKQLKKLLKLISFLNDFDSLIECKGYCSGNECCSIQNLNKIICNYPPESAGKIEDLKTSEGCFWSYTAGLGDWIIITVTCKCASTPTPTKTPTPTRILSRTPTRGLTRTSTALPTP